MFTDLLLSSTILFNVTFSDYSKSHYKKEFEKKYKGKIWEKTESSILEDLKRLRIQNNTTQKSSQIDQLNHKGEYWLFKYDFKIAGTNESPKTSGNRIIGLIDNKFNAIKILLIYAKTDLPKNKGEKAFGDEIIKNIYPEISELFK